MTLDFMNLRTQEIDGFASLLFGFSVELSVSLKGVILGGLTSRLSQIQRVDNLNHFFENETISTSVCVLLMMGEEFNSQIVFL